MSNRYTQLFSLPQNQYSEGAPVLIEAGALLNDSQTNKILAQLKYKNLQEKRIKAMNIRIQPMDVLGNPLGDAIAFQYLDLAAEYGESFGSKTPIELPDNTARSFSAEVCSVVFDDNSVWEATDASWETLNKPIPFYTGKNQELQKQYQLLYGSSAIYQLQEMKDLWQCVCGAIHKNTTPTCHVCRNSLTDLRRFDMDALKEACAQRLDATAKADASKRKKTRTLAIVIGSLITTAVALMLLWNPVIQPSIKYNEAISLLKAGEYEQAGDIFISMPDYKDSSVYLDDFITLFETRIDENGYIESYEYDSMGNLLKLILMDSDGEIYYTFSYEYDTMGNCIKEIYTDSDGNTYDDSYSYEYDSLGNIVKKTQQDSDGDIDSYSYEYDSMGILINETQLDSDGEIDRTISYEYDNTGNLINKTIMHSNGDIATYSYEYDKTGNLIKEIFVDIVGITETNSYEYDNGGNPIKKIHMNSMGDEYTRFYSYEYDNMGNLIKEICEYSDGEIEIDTYSYEYDSRGNIIKEVQMGSNGNIYSYEYSNPRVFYKPKS